MYKSMIYSASSIQEQQENFLAHIQEAMTVGFATYAGESGQLIRSHASYDWPVIEDRLPRQLYYAKTSLSPYQLLQSLHRDLHLPSSLKAAIKEVIFTALPNIEPQILSSHWFVDGLTALKQSADHPKALWRYLAFYLPNMHYLDLTMVLSDLINQAESLQYHLSAGFSPKQLQRLTDTKQALIALKGFVVEEFDFENTQDALAKVYPGKALKPASKVLKHLQLKQVVYQQDKDCERQAAQAAWQHERAQFIENFKAAHPVLSRAANGVSSFFTYTASTLDTVLLPINYAAQLGFKMASSLAETLPYQLPTPSLTSQQIQKILLLGMAANTLMPALAEKWVTPDSTGSDLAQCLEMTPYTPTLMYQPYPLAYSSWQDAPLNNKATEHEDFFFQPWNQTEMDGVIKGENLETVLEQVKNNPNDFRLSAAALHYLLDQRVNLAPYQALFKPLLLNVSQHSYFDDYQVGAIITRTLVSHMDNSDSFSWMVELKLPLKILAANLLRMQFDYFPDQPVNLWRYFIEIKTNNLNDEIEQIRQYYEMFQALPHLVNNRINLATYLINKIKHIKDQYHTAPQLLEDWKTKVITYEMPSDVNRKQSEVPDVLNIRSAYHAIKVYAVIYYLLGEQEFIRALAHYRTRLSEELHHHLKVFIPFYYRIQQGLQPDYHTSKRFLKLFKQALDIMDYQPLKVDGKNFLASGIDSLKTILLNSDPTVDFTEGGENSLFSALVENWLIEWYTINSQLLTLSVSQTEYIGELVGILLAAIEQHEQREVWMRKLDWLLIRLFVHFKNHRLTEVLKTLSYFIPQGYRLKCQQKKLAESEFSFKTFPLLNVFIQVSAKLDHDRKKGNVITIEAFFSEHLPLISPLLNSAQDYQYFFEKGTVLLQEKSTFCKKGYDFWFQFAKQSVLQGKDLTGLLQFVLSEEKKFKKSKVAGTETSLSSSTYSWTEELYYYASYGLVKSLKNLQSVSHAAPDYIVEFVNQLENYVFMAPFIEPRGSFDILLKARQLIAPHFKVVQLYLPSKVDVRYFEQFLKAYDSFLSTIISRLNDKTYPPELTKEIHSWISDSILTISPYIESWHPKSWLPNSDLAAQFSNKVLILLKHLIKISLLIDNYVWNQAYMDLSEVAYGFNATTKLQELVNQLYEAEEISWTERFSLALQFSPALNAVFTLACLLAGGSVAFGLYKGCQSRLQAGRGDRKILPPGFTPVIRTPPKNTKSVTQGTPPSPLRNLSPNTSAQSAAHSPDSSSSDLLSPHSTANINQANIQQQEQNRQLIGQLRALRAQRFEQWDRISEQLESADRNHERRGTLPPILENLQSEQQCLSGQYTSICHQIRASLEYARIQQQFEQDLETFQGKCSRYLICLERKARWEEPLTLERYQRVKTHLQATLTALLGEENLPADAFARLLPSPTIDLETITSIEAFENCLNQNFNILDWAQTFIRQLINWPTSSLIQPLISPILIQISQLSVEQIASPETQAMLSEFLQVCSRRLSEIQMLLENDPYGIADLANGDARPAHNPFDAIDTATFDGFVEQFRENIREKKGIDITTFIQPEISDITDLNQLKQWKAYLSRITKCIRSRNDFLDGCCQPVLEQQAEIKARQACFRANWQRQYPSYFNILPIKDWQQSFQTVDHSWEDINVCLLSENNHYPLSRTAQVLNCENLLINLYTSLTQLLEKPIHCSEEWASDHPVFQLNALDATLHSLIPQGVLLSNLYQAGEMLTTCIEARQALISVVQKHDYDSANILSDPDYSQKLSAFIKQPLLAYLYNLQQDLEQKAKIAQPDIFNWLLKEEKSSHFNSLLSSKEFMPYLLAKVAILDQAITEIKPSAVQANQNSVQAHLNWSSTNQKQLLSIARLMGEIICTLPEEHPLTNALKPQISAWETFMEECSRWRVFCSQSHTHGPIETEDFHKLYDRLNTLFTLLRPYLSLKLDTHVTAPLSATQHLPHTSEMTTASLSQVRHLPPTAAVFRSASEGEITYPVLSSSLIEGHLVQFTLFAQPSSEGLNMENIITFFTQKYEFCQRHLALFESAGGLTEDELTIRHILAHTSYLLTPGEHIFEERGHIRSQIFDELKELKTHWGRAQHLLPFLRTKNVNLNALVRLHLQLLVRMVVHLEMPGSLNNPAVKMSVMDIYLMLNELLRLVAQKDPSIQLLRNDLWHDKEVDVSLALNALSATLYTLAEKQFPYQLCQQDLEEFQQIVAGYLASFETNFPLEKVECPTITFERLSTTNRDRGEDEEAAPRHA